MKILKRLIIKVQKLKKFINAEWSSLVSHLINYLKMIHINDKILMIAIK